MISQQIIEKIDTLRAGGQIAPLLVTEEQACDIYTLIFGEEIITLDELEMRGINDFLYYDCADRSHKGSENYKVKILKEHTEKLYQKPSGDILVALFRNIEALRAS
jgi:hypothetical protein